MLPQLIAGVKFKAAREKAQWLLSRLKLEKRFKHRPAELSGGEQQLLEFEDQLQQIEMLVNLKKVADPLLGYAETALHNAQKALDGITKYSINAEFLKSFYYNF